MSNVIRYLNIAITDPAQEVVLDDALYVHMQTLTEMGAEVSAGIVEELIEAIKKAREE